MLNPAHAIELFVKAPDIRLYQAGETIFEVGTVGQVMYGVIEGEVEMVVNGKVFETIQAGDIFGEGALVQTPPLRASTAIAKTNCKLAAVNQSHFKFLVQETPLFALEVIRSMSTRLRGAKASLS